VKNICYTKYALTKGDSDYMKKFTEGKAVSIITSNGGDVRGKIILTKNGFKGLKACAALDYLVNHCGYKANI